VLIQPKILLFRQKFLNSTKKINWPLAMIDRFKTGSESVKNYNKQIETKKSLFFSSI